MHAQRVCGRGRGARRALGPTLLVAAALAAVGAGLAQASLTPTTTPAGGVAQAPPMPAAPPGGVAQAASTPATTPAPAPTAEGRVVGERAVGVAPHAAGAAALADASRAPVAAAAARPVAHTAQSGGVTISGFSFRPGAITVHVGDTVTWSNHDAPTHTATADDGSFDTGKLPSGRSGSHTFTSAGTFSYHCSIHPSMHGTVTVLASVGSATAPAPSSAGSTAARSAAAPASSTSRSSTAARGGTAALPSTGADVPLRALAGLALLLAGVALRRLVVRRPP
jgi:plastocyanin